MALLGTVPGEVVLQPVLTPISHLTWSPQLMCIPLCTHVPLIILWLCCTPIYAFPNQIWFLICHCQSVAMESLVWTCFLFYFSPGPYTFSSQPDLTSFHFPRSPNYLLQQECDLLIIVKILLKIILWTAENKSILGICHCITRESYS